MLYFQCEEVTGILDAKYGDIHSQIVEMEFVLLQLLEKEVMDGSE